MRVDVHSHVLPSGYAERLGGGPAVDSQGVAAVLGAAAELADLEARLGLMDETGIDVSILSLPPPGPGFGLLGTVAEVAAEANDEMLDLAALASGRFGVLIALPLPDSEAAIEEVRRLADHPLVCGAAAIVDHGHWDPADPEHDPLYAELGARGLPLMLHPGIEELPAAYGDWNLALALGAPVASTLGILRLVLGGSLDRAPSLTPIVPHLGGLWPYLTQRVDDQCAAPAGLVPSARLANRILLDTCSFHPPALRCALDTVGVDRVLLGSDFPFRGKPARCVEDIEDLQLTMTERDAILGDNACRHLPGAPLAGTVETSGEVAL